MESFPRIQFLFLPHTIWWSPKGSTTLANGTGGIPICHPQSQPILQACRARTHGHVDAVQGRRTGGNGIQPVTSMWECREVSQTEKWTSGAASRRSWYEASSMQHDRKHLWQGVSISSRETQSNLLAASARYVTAEVRCVKTLGFWRKILATRFLKCTLELM